MSEQDKPGQDGPGQGAGRKGGPRKPGKATASSGAAAQKDGGAESAPESGRIAKILARAGVASRRDAEKMVAEGRVRVNGKVLESPAVVISMSDAIEVDGEPIGGIERTRLWIYHKPAGLVTTNKDPEGRATVFEKLPRHLPRVLSVGRLDINTEGLLLLTNDGGLARALELPSTGWLRRYRVRAYGDVDQAALDRLKDGIAVDGILYGAIEAVLDRKQGHNVWITMGLREGKNREVKNVLGALGLEVNRLIRISYGPFQLGDLGEGEVVEIRSRMLREQLGERMIAEAGANFDAPVIDRTPPRPQPAAKPKAEARPTRREWISGSEKNERARARLDTKPDFGGRKTGFADRPDRGGPKDRDRRDERGERKPFDRAAAGSEKPGAKPPRKPFIQRSRASNVWMAPGARPVAETRGEADAAKTDRPRGKTGAKPDLKAATRKGSFPKSRAKPRPDADTDRSGSERTDAARAGRNKPGPKGAASSGRGKGPAGSPTKGRGRDSTGGKAPSGGKGRGADRRR